MSMLAPEMMEIMKALWPGNSRKFGFPSKTQLPLSVRLLMKMVPKEKWQNGSRRFGGWCLCQLLSKSPEGWGLDCQCQNILQNVGIRTFILGFGAYLLFWHKRLMSQWKSCFQVHFGQPSMEVFPQAPSASQSPASSHLMTCPSFKTHQECTGENFGPLKHPQFFF